MKIVTPYHLDQFDKLKEEIYHKKTEQRKGFQGAQSSKPDLPKKSRGLLKYGLLIGGIGIGVSYFLPELMAIALDNGLISRPRFHALSTLLTDFKGKFIHLPFSKNEKVKYSIANQVYFSKIQSDLNHISLRRNQKMLFSESKSKFTIWVLYFKNEDRSKLINEYGDFVERIEKSYFKINHILKLRSYKCDKMLKREKIYNFYRQMAFNSQNVFQMNEIENRFKQECNLINFFNLMHPQSHADAMSQCHEKVKQIGRDISKVVFERVKKQELERKKQT